MRIPVVIIALCWGVMAASPAQAGVCSAFIGKRIAITGKIESARPSSSYENGGVSDNSWEIDTHVDIEGTGCVIVQISGLAARGDRYPSGCDRKGFSFDATAVVGDDVVAVPETTLGYYSLDMRHVAHIFCHAGPAVEPGSRDWTQCANRFKVFSHDVVISSCSAVIRAGIEGKRNTLIAHFNRGKAYELRHEYGRARADLDEVKRLRGSIIDDWLDF